MRAEELDNETHHRVEQEIEPDQFAGGVGAADPPVKNAENQELRECFVQLSRM